MQAEKMADALGNSVGSRLSVSADTFMVYPNCQSYAGQNKFQREDAI